MKSQSTTQPFTLIYQHKHASDSTTDTYAHSVDVLIWCSHTLQGPLKAFGVGVTGLSWGGVVWKRSRDWEMITAPPTWADLHLRYGLMPRSALSGYSRRFVWTPTHVDLDVDLSVVQMWRMVARDAAGLEMWHLCLCFFCFQVSWSFKMREVYWAFLPFSTRHTTLLITWTYGHFSFGKLEKFYVLSSETCLIPLFHFFLEDVCALGCVLSSGKIYCIEPEWKQKVWN